MNRICSILLCYQFTVNASDYFQLNLIKYSDNSSGKGLFLTKSELRVNLIQKIHLLAHSKANKDEKKQRDFSKQ